MGLVRGVARTAAIAGTATAVSNRVSRRQATRWAQKDAAAQGNPPGGGYASAPPPPPPPPPPPAQDQGDLTADLERLASLRNSGVLSDEEFAAAKAKLLGI